MEPTSLSAKQQASEEGGQRRVPSTDSSGSICNGLCLELLKQIRLHLQAARAHRSRVSHELESHQKCANAAARLEATLQDRQFQGLVATAKARGLQSSEDP
jgi:hypothetical protein